MLIEPDTEVVQSHPRCQTCPQSTQLVRALPPEAESVEQLLVDTLHDLADGGNPPPQALGPGFTAVALTSTGWPSTPTTSKRLEHLYEDPYGLGRPKH